MSRHRAAHQPFLRFPTMYKPRHAYKEPDYGISIFMDEVEAVARQDEFHRFAEAFATSDQHELLDYLAFRNMELGALALSGI